MSIYLKIKDTFDKALKKGIECDSVFLTDDDYINFCSDFKMENISEITINNIKLSIVKNKELNNSFIKSTKEKDKKIVKNKNILEQNKFYLKK